MKDQKLLNVRFKEPVLLGLNLEPCSAIHDGMNVDGKPAYIHFYNDMFMKVTYDKHTQFVPWAAISTALFEELPKAKAK